MKAIIECVSCGEEFKIERILYSNEEIPDLDSDELKNWAEETGVRFDCPICEDVMYLSDCNIY